MNVIISNAKPEDAEQIQKLYYETWVDTYRNDEHGITLENLQYRYRDSMSEKSIDWLRDFIKSKIPDNNKYLTAKVDSKVIGVSYLEKEIDHNRLHGLYILPEYQSKGMGKMFWEEAKKFFDLKNKTILEVAVYNAKAIGFYKKLGFIDTGKRYPEERITDEKIVKIPMMEMNLPPLL